MKADESILAVIQNVECCVDESERIKDEFLAVGAERGEVRDSRDRYACPVDSDAVVD